PAPSPPAMIVNSPDFIIKLQSSIIFTSLKYLSKNIGNEIQCYSNPLESLDGLTTSYNKLFCDDKDKLVRKHKLKQSLNL
ncbi:MAG TPA: hypothetical protein PLV54_02680, partial [Anaerostipes hadrus]|nr:hypothetical protein [Anaerostipes hadrus]